MIERTPMLLAAAAAILSLSACGDRATVPGMAGAPDQASEEPIDAVPLPLDDNPMSPPPAVAPAAKAKDMAAEPDEAAAVGEPLSTETAAEGADPAPAPPRIVVAPHEPVRPVERPVQPPVPAKDGEKPVLNF